MPISLRGKVFAAFILVAGVMGAVTVISVNVLNDQNRAAAAADERQDRVVDAMADLRSTPFEAEGLVMNHLHAHEDPRKEALAADLLGVETREALALSALSDLAQGPEKALVTDLKLLASQAADLRQRIMAISARNAVGRATILATREMPGLRAEVTSGLRAVGLQSGATLAAARAEAALNAMAAGQKNAILNPDPAYVTGQLAAIAVAQADFTAAFAALQANPAPGLAPLQALVVSLQKLDAQMETSLRDSGYDTAETIYDLQLRPMDMDRLGALDDLAALMQTGRRMVDETVQGRVNTWQTILITLADLALVLGFSGMMLALSKIGRGLEGAVQLAERMAQSEVVPPAWVENTLAGRLTSALVRISAGQSAVLASLEAVATGRTPRRELPEALRERFAAVSALMTPDVARQNEANARARDALGTLQGTLREAQHDAAALRDGAEGMVTAIGPQAEAVALADLASRQTLIAERHVATLILAEREAVALAERLCPAPGPLMRRTA